MNTATSIKMYFSMTVIEIRENDSEIFDTIIARSESITSEFGVRKGHGYKVGHGVDVIFRAATAELA